MEKIRLETKKRFKVIGYMVALENKKFAPSKKLVKLKNVIKNICNKKTRIMARFDFVMTNEFKLTSIHFFLLAAKPVRVMTIR
jgi:hypothetical protein